MQDARGLKVLSVVGAGRSGTTVMAAVLGEYDGFAAAGELRFLWKRGLQDRRPCACRQPPADCAVWSQVVSKVVGPQGPARTAAVQRVVAAQHELRTPRASVRAIRLAADPAAGGWLALQTVRQASISVCQALASVTSAQIVIDTSKRALDASLLTSGEAIEQYVVHVVRDPRAVVHSWRNAKSFDAGGRTRSIGTRRLPGTVRRWWWSALTIAQLHRRIDESRWLRVRYEDFARDPQAVVARVMRLLDEAPAGSPFVGSDTVELHPSHMVAGNPSRFDVGTVNIRLDERWRTAMPRRDQRLIALATGPLMRRFGYRL
ncbi:MAG: sulfotransferase [Nocardioidaceae bacterium]